MAPGASVTPITSATDRLWSRVEKTDGCWLWTGAKNTGGYGMIQVGGRPIGAHRLSWELAHGPIPKGAMVLHSCDVRHCVRPDHLRVGSALENAADAVARGRKRSHYDYLVSLRSAALRLGVQPATLRQQIRNGKLAATMLGGWHVRTSEVERYLRENRRG